MLYDAYVEAKPTAALNLRVGKFKPPIGLERLQSATDVRFVERGLPTSLVPNRDVGVQLFGDLAGSRVQYQVGAFDGAPDAAIVDGDVVDGKGRRGPRVPASVRDDQRRRPTSARRRGEQRHGAGHADRDRAAELQDDGPAVAVPLSRRRDGGEHGDRQGRRTRVSPQGYLYAGPVGVLAEYVRSTQHVRRATTRVDALTTQAWQVSGGWVLTGERESYTGIAPEPSAGRRQARADSARWSSWRATAC